MGDAQSAQRDGTSEAAAEEQSAVEQGASGESTHDKLMQNNGQISECNSNGPDGTTADVNDPCEDQFAKEAVIVEDKGILVTRSALEEVPNVQIIQEELPDPNEEEPIEIINMDAKQNDLNESFRKFFSNIGLKLTVKKGSGDQTDDKREKKGIEKLDVLEETTNSTKYEDVEQTTDLNAIQDTDSTTCPTLTEGTSDDVAVTVEEKITETKEIADNAENQGATVTVDEQDGNQKHSVTLEQSPTNQEEEEFVSPIKKFFTTGIFAGLKKKKIEGEAEDKELVDMSKNDVDATVDQRDIVEASPNVDEQEIECKEVQEEAIKSPEVEDSGKSPSTDQDSESEMTSSQEKVQSSPLKRLFSGTTFKRRSKRQKGRRSSDSKLSDSGEQIANPILASTEKTEQQDIAIETPSPPALMTDPEEELSAWEAFKKLMTPKKSLKRASIGSEEVQVQAEAGEETKPSEGERISDHSTEEGRKRKDSSHSWEAVLCGSGRRRSRKTSDSEDEQKQDVGEGESSNEAGEAGPSDSESSTWKSFKKLMTPKRKVKDDEESKDNVQLDSEATQDETLFSIKKILSGRKKGKSGDKQDQLSSDEGDKEVVSMEEDSETPAVVPLSEFDKSETEETAKTDDEIQDSDHESEQEHILEIPKTFVQEVQEHQVTPVLPLNQDQDELTEFDKYQPLSDIPEEGNITETVATSLIEDVAKDDTIADDMVELTSEAITAPEPVDITMADETDELMLSAASHLTESSKTSGNATPVPVEYDVKDTEVLLKEVVETISTAPKAYTFYSEEPALERGVGSVTHKMFETSVNEEANVMELHAQSDAMTFETGLQVDQIKDTDVEIPVTILSESLSEFKDAISTEYVSEVSKGEFESAKIDVDEIHSAQQKWAVKQESVDDSDYMIESLSEVPEYIDVVLQDENVVQDVLPGECHEGQPVMVRTVSTELLLEEKIKEIDHLMAEQTESEHAQLITSDPELPKCGVNSIVEIDKEEEAIKEREALLGSAIQRDQPAAEEIIEVLSLEGTPKLSNEQTAEEIHEVTDTSMDKELSNEHAPGEIYEVTEASEDKVLSSEQAPGEIHEVTDTSVDKKLPSEQAPGEIHEVTDASVDKELPSEQAPGEIHEVTDTSVDKELSIEQVTGEIGEVTEVEIVTEDDFEIVYMQDVEDIQEPTLESQKLAEDAAEEVAVQEETVPMTDLAAKEESLEDIAIEESEQEAIGENDEDITEEQSSEINVEAGKEDVSVTEVTIEQESREQPDDVVADVAISQVEDATNILLEKSFEEEFMEQIVPSSDQEIMEQTNEEVSTEATQQDDIAELEDTSLTEVAADEIDDKVEVLKTMKSQPQEIVSEEAANVLNGLVIVSTAEEAISQLDHALYVNGDHSEAKPSEAQIMQLHNRHEAAEDFEALPVEHVSLVNEDSGIAQVLEDTVNIEKSSEMYILSTTEEPIHEVHISEMEVNTEEHMEEEIPCPLIEVAEVEHAALLEQSMVALQQVTATMPDLMIQKSDDSDKIAEETSIPCVDNAEVLDEPTHEVQLTEVEQVCTQGEKEEQIVSPETTNVDVQHTLVPQLTTCSFNNVASQLPEVSIETTTAIHEPILGMGVSEHVEQEALETTPPLEVNNITQIAQEGTTVLVHVPAVEFEDSHQVQVQVLNMDIQSAEARVDTALEIGVQEDKEVVDSCHERVERIDSFLATSNIEPAILSEKDNVAIQEVVQQEIAPESDESECKVIDLVESKLSDDCKMIESQDQSPAVAVIPDSVMATKEQVLTKMDEDVKEQASVQNQVAPSGNTAVAVPQNTGIISSVGNIEAPSSLSLEFKLNIQFGQCKAPTLPPQPAHIVTEQTISSPTHSPKATPLDDRNEPTKTTEMSEVGVQAVEEETKQENEPKKTEIVTAEAEVQATETIEDPDLTETLKSEELMDVGIQPTELEEPIMTEETAIEMTKNKTVLMDLSTQYTEIAEQGEEVKPEITIADNQPVLIDIGTQSIQQEKNEDIKTTVEEMSIIQIAVQQDKEEKRVLQTELVVLQVSKDHIKQTEDDDENQDVWMDAEEDIDAQEQIMPLCEIEESIESEPDYFQETKTDFEESIENIKKIALKCDIDSEGEDFAVALEDPKMATAIATIEWD